MFDILIVVFPHAYIRENKSNRKDKPTSICCRNKTRKATIAKQVVNLLFNLTWRNKATIKRMIRSKEINGYSEKNVFIFFW